MKPRYDTKKHPVNYVAGPADVNIATGVLFDDSEGVTYASWFDPVNQRMFSVSETIVNEANHFSWRDDLDREFDMMPMTPEVYEKYVAPLIPDSIELKTQKELDDWFTEGVWKTIYG